MSERLNEFVLGMSKDLDRAKRLTADPHAELEQTDLSPEDKDVILSRDPDRIREAAGFAASDPLSMNSFLEPTPKPAPPSRKPTKRPARKPATRKPSRKAPARKRPSKKTTASKRGARKTARKSARKPARKGTGRRR